MVLHPDEAERCRKVYEKAFEQREPFQLEHRLRRHDGEYRWVATAGLPRYKGDGSFVGYIGTSVDITERKLAEAALGSEVNPVLAQRLPANPDTAEREKGFVDVGPFVVANAQTTELIEPSERPLDDPAPPP
jgi:hypothetical protein